MTIQHRNSIFEFDDGSPSTTFSGSKDGGHCWKYCPYSTQITNYNGDSRVPEGDKRYHPETEGFMHSHGGPSTMGWICADNNCSFFLGTFATTITGIAVPQAGREFESFDNSTPNPLTGLFDCPQSADSLAVLSGTVNLKIRNRTIVPGTRYYEI